MLVPDSQYTIGIGYSIIKSVSFESTSINISSIERKVRKWIKSIGLNSNWGTEPVVCEQDKYSDLVLHSLSTLH